MKLTARETISPSITRTVRKAWMVMRITTLILLTAALHVSARTSAQKISLSDDNISVEQFFSQLEKQTGYSFLLEKGIVPPDQKLSVHVTDASLEQVLDQTLKPLSLTYKVENGIVYILKTKPQAPGLALSPPPIDIHGRIVNENGEPVVGASVQVKGTELGAMTDADGNFELKGVDEKATLTVSGVSIETFEIAVKGKKDLGTLRGRIRIAVMRDAIVNKGYYSESQLENPGNVSVITAKDIEKQPVGDLALALKGRIPGLEVTQSNGISGSRVNIIVRGLSSIANGSDPLFLVDGVPYITEDPLRQGLITNGGSPFDLLNPSDIESITVLKDADATAIYGSRGANGVILITTKKGKAGTTKVNLRAYTGIGQVAHTVKYLNTEQYLAMRHEALNNDGLSPDPYSDHDLLTWDTTRYTDWQKKLIGGSALFTDAQGSVSGGTENIQYMIGAGFHRETTVFPGNRYNQKGSVHFNLNTTSPNKKLKTELSATYVAQGNNLMQTDFTSFLQYLPPDAPPIYNPDGSLNWANSTWPLPDGNPYTELRLIYKTTGNNLLAHEVLSYTVLPGLEAKLSVGYNNIQTHEKIGVPTTFFDPAWGITTGSATFSSSIFNSWIVEPQLNYTRKISKGRLSLLVGGTLQQKKTDWETISADGYTNDALITDPQAGTSFNIGSTIVQYNYNAVFGWLNYVWQEKYVVDFTARRDASSRFGPGKQFANFGSGAFAWIFSKEKFVQDKLPFLSTGKIRSSYGSSGSDQIGDYKFLDLYNLTRYPYQGALGVLPAGLYNPLLAWESDRKFEVGLDLGFVKDRIIIKGDYYRSRSSNQLIATPLSSVTGFGSINENRPAVVQNSGFEFVLNTVNINSKNFDWQSSLNLSINRNKLIAFPGLAQSSYASRLEIGKPITIQKLYHFAGVNDTTGLYQFYDSKGGLTYTPGLNDMIGMNLFPDYYGGFQNTFRFKQFQLDIFLHFVHQKGSQFLYNVLPGVAMVNQPVTVLDRWQKPGDHAPYQRFNTDYSAYDAYNYAIQSDQLISSASYIRLQNLSLSYNVPTGSRKNAAIKSFRIYVQGQNLLTITKYTGYDPETQSSSNLPPLRVWTFGFELGL